MHDILKQSLGTVAALVLVASLTGCEQQGTRLGVSAGTDLAAVESTPESTGRHLIAVSGCNDCHTVGWEERAGDVPESEWLTGSPLGWYGPWGTTYAPNLRLSLTGMTEDAFLAMARTRTSRPPMPWQNLKLMTDDELRGIYRFIRSLGPAGTTAPAYLPPDQTPEPPYAHFVVPTQTETH